MTLTGRRRRPATRGTARRRASRVARRSRAAIDDDGAARARRLRRMPARFVQRRRRGAQRGGRRRSCVAGEAQPPEVHALAHWMNQRLGVDRHDGRIRAAGRRERGTAAGILRRSRRRHERWRSRDASHPRLQSGLFRARAISASRRRWRACQCAFITGFMRTRRRALCAWHLPALHALEGWGDARTPEGTVIDRAAADHTALRRPLRICCARVRCAVTSEQPTGRLRDPLALAIAGARATSRHGGGRACATDSSPEAPPHSVSPGDAALPEGS